MAIRNLEWLRALPEIGGRLYEIISDLDNQHRNLAQQVNGSGNKQPNAPPAIGGLKVTGSNGHFSIAITDDSPFFRGINYFLEHADNPHFINPHVIDLGASRNHNVFLGNVTRYFRAYSSYLTTKAGPAVYFGSQAQPVPVVGGGPVGGPNFTLSQGSGTGNPGTGLQGPGVAPFRSTTGAPPER
jgi:hypothetical protein